MKKYLRNERVVHVHYVAIDDLVITTPLKKNDIAALCSYSGKAGASLLGQGVVASLLCMAKWLRKWRQDWLYVRSNTKNAKSLLCGLDLTSRMWGQGRGIKLASENAFTDLMWNESTCTGNA